MLRKSPKNIYIGRLLFKAAESALAVLVGLAAGALLMLAYRYDIWKAYSALFIGAFGDIEGILETLAFATPLILTALVFAIGVRTGLFNVGAEGQMYIGAVAASYAGGIVSMPPILHLVFATAFSMVAGALYAIPVSALKTYRGVHEVVSTIMLNWTAFWLAQYLITYVVADPARAERAVPAAETARYSLIGASLTTVFLVTLAAAGLTYFIMWRTTAGYEMRVVGYSLRVARYAGIPINRSFTISFLLGGALAGLAGASQVLGRPPHWTVFATMGNIMYLGFEGIGVALVGRNHPLGIVLAAIFYGGLLHGGRFMEFQAGVASEIVRAINGFIIIALAVPGLLDIVRSRLRRGREK
jgi:ABC-type uncharacterized transport system permease subunit